MKKDIEYLSKHFESEMENFSFEKNAIAAGVAMGTAGGLLGPVGVLGAAVTLKFGKKGILGKIFTNSGHSEKKMHPKRPQQITKMIMKNINLVLGYVLVKIMKMIMKIGLTKQEMKEDIFTKKL